MAGLRRAELVGEANSSSGRFTADHCANCHTPLEPSNDSLFCGPTCTDEAKLVRYWRSVIRDGRIADPEIRNALRTRRTHWLNGGYDAIARRLTEAARSAVWARDDGRCIECGAPGGEIDHIHGSSNVLANLQLLCRECHHRKTESSMVPASDQDKARIREFEITRVFCVTPANRSDDEGAWKAQNRTLKSERRKRLKALAVELFGYDGTTGVGKAWTATWLDMEAEAAGPDVPATPDDDSGYGPGSYFERSTQRDD